MTVSYFVRYDIEADDLQAFIRYYRERHVPVLATWPGIRSVSLHTSEYWNDPFPVNKGNTALLVQMVFDSKQSLDVALHSESRSFARHDFANFPKFEGIVTHQMMQSEEIFSGRP
jgi:uncharacterized protein (TIGR02118 family)